MSNKKRKKPASQKPKATKSFDQLVAGATSAKLERQVDEKIAQAAYAIQQNLANALLQSLTPIQVSHMVLKNMLMNKLEFTEENWMFQETEAVDQSLGYETVEGPAKEGDFVRVRVKAKKEGEDEFGPEELLEIPSLLKAQQNTPTIPEIEVAVEGKSAGDTVEVKETPEENETPFMYEVSIYKVSRKKEGTDATTQSS